MNDSLNDYPHSRRSKLSQRQQIRLLRMSGMPIVAIAEIYSTTVSRVHKICEAAVERKSRELTPS